MLISCILKKKTFFLRPLLIMGIILTPLEGKAEFWKESPLEATVSLTLGTGAGLATAFYLNRIFSFNSLSPSYQIVIKKPSPIETSSLAKKDAPPKKVISWKKKFFISTVSLGVGILVTYGAHSLMTKLLGGKPSRGIGGKSMGNHKGKDIKDIKDVGEGKGQVVGEKSSLEKLEDALKEKSIADVYEILKKSPNITEPSFLTGRKGQESIFILHKIVGFEMKDEETKKIFRDIIRIFKEKGLDVAAENKEKKPALVKAVEIKNKEAIHILLEEEEDSLLTYKPYEAALFRALSVGSSKEKQVRNIINMFLRIGLDINADFPYSIHKGEEVRKTGLSLAVQLKKPIIVRLLLEAGANPNLQDSGSLQTPLHVLLDSFESNNDLLLSALVAIINVFSPHCNEEFEIAKCLLAKNPNFILRDEQKNTPIDILLYYNGRYEDRMTELFLNHNYFNMRLAREKASPFSLNSFSRIKLLSQLVEKGARLNFEDFWNSEKKETLEKILIALEKEKNPGNIIGERAAKIWENIRSINQQGQVNRIQEEDQEKFLRALLHPPFPSLKDIAAAAVSLEDIEKMNCSKDILLLIIRGTCCPDVYTKSWNLLENKKEKRN